MATTLAVVAYVAVVAVLAGLAVVAWRRRSGPVRVGEPDHVSEEMVSGLLAELRKAQAETAYWKAAAERLQHEADHR